MPEAMKPFMAAAAAMLPVFMLVQFLANPFGFDRDGFRALILCPAERRLILLGKNLACLPVGLVLGALPLAFVTVWLRLPALAVAAALFQFATLLLLAALAGRPWLSPSRPYPVSATSTESSQSAAADAALASCFSTAMAQCLPPAAGLAVANGGLAQG